MRRFGLTLASLGLFLSMGIGAANAQCAAFDAPREFYGYVPSMNAPAPSEWFIPGDRVAVERTALAPACQAPVLNTCAPACAAPVAAAACAAPVVAPVATCAPVASCGPKVCDNPCLHGINGSLQVQPTVGIRGNDLIVQPTASLIGGNNPYLAPVIQSSNGIIQPTLGVDYLTNVIPTNFAGATTSPVLYDNGAFGAPAIYNGYNGFNGYYGGYGWGRGYNNGRFLNLRLGGAHLGF